MNEEGFHAFMKKKRKSESTTKNSIAATKELEAYLEIQGLAFDNLSVPKLETFISDYLEKKRTAKFLWSVNHFFLFLGRDDLLHASNSVREQLVQKTRKPFKIKDFRGVMSIDVAQLEALGIKDVASMLERGKTHKLRKQLANESGFSTLNGNPSCKISNPEYSRIPLSESLSKYT